MVILRIYSFCVGMQRNFADAQLLSHLLRLVLLADVWAGLAITDFSNVLGENSCEYSCHQTVSLTRAHMLTKLAPVVMIGENTGV